MPVTVEVCVDSVESAISAQAGGAHRVELCDNLIEGGTTPSIGSIETARSQLDINLHVIIRPRGGDFLYSDLEFEIMCRDIEASQRLGADGVVIGILERDGRVDRLRTARLVGLARPMSVTFHRAFDVTRDPFEALDDLIALGIDRVLTSGQEATAAEGMGLIERLVKYAGDRITIMACGNLQAGNLPSFISATCVEEVHLTGSRTVESEMIYRNDRVFMGGDLRLPEYSRKVTSSEVIRAAVQAASR